MDAKFTPDVCMAISAVLSLVQGNLYIPSGVEYVRPVWRNFQFFRRISIEALIRTSRVKPSGGEPGYWDIKRHVCFFHYDQKVAEVTLIGMKVDANGGWWWAVKSIKYLDKLNEPDLDRNASWCEVDLNPQGLTLCENIMQ